MAIICLIVNQPLAENTKQSRPPFPGTRLRLYIRSEYTIPSVSCTPLQTDTHTASDSGSAA